MRLIRNNLLVFLILTFISAAVIFYKFNLIPQNLTFDEVDSAMLALSLKGNSYTPYSPLATGHTTLYYYTMMGSFTLFGVNNFALRFPSALFGILGSAMFFLLMRLVFKKNLILPIITTIIFSTSRWYFNFARFSFEATFLLFLELTSVYFLFKFFQSKQNKYLYLVLTGLFAGLAFNSYVPGRVFFLLPLIYILIKLWKITPSSNHIGKVFLLFLIPFIIAITPLSFYFSTHQDDRVDKLFFWKNHEMTIGEKVNGTIQNIGTIASMFAIKGDMSGKHNYPGKPAINPILGLLLFAGIFTAIKKIRVDENKFFLGFFLLALLPSVAIYPWENPNMLRTHSAIASVVYFIGVALNEIAIFITNLKNKTIYITCLLSIAVILLISTFYELRTYFFYQAAIFPTAFESTPTLPESLKHTNFKY